MIRFVQSIYVVEGVKVRPSSNSRERSENRRKKQNVDTKENHFNIHFPISLLKSLCFSSIIHKFHFVTENQFHSTAKSFPSHFLQKRKNGWLVNENFNFSSELWMWIDVLSAFLNVYQAIAYSFDEILVKLPHSYLRRR